MFKRGSKFYIANTTIRRESNTYIHYVEGVSISKECFLIRQLRFCSFEAPNSIFLKVFKCCKSKFRLPGVRVNLTQPGPGVILKSQPGPGPGVILESQPGPGPGPGVNSKFQPGIPGKPGPGPGPGLQH